VPKKSLVLVEFEDPALFGRWTDLAEEMDPLRCMAVGFLLKRTKDKIVLVQVWNENDEHTGVFALPKGCVKSITKLRSAD